MVRKRVDLMGRVPPRTYKDLLVVGDVGAVGDGGAGELGSAPGAVLSVCGRRIPKSEQDNENPEALEALVGKAMDILVGSVWDGALVQVDEDVFARVAGEGGVEVLLGVKSGVDHVCGIGAVCGGGKCRVWRGEEMQKGKRRWSTAGAGQIYLSIEELPLGPRTVGRYDAAEGKSHRSGVRAVRGGTRTDLQDGEMALPDLHASTNRTLSREAYAGADWPVSDPEIQ
nr:hypothetical protein CFP56_34803 [Quercus suber]